MLIACLINGFMPQREKDKIAENVTSLIIFPPLALTSIYTHKLFFMVSWQPYLMVSIGW